MVQANKTGTVAVFRPKASQRRLGIICFLLVGSICPVLYFFFVIFGSVNPSSFYYGGNGQANLFILVFLIGTVLFGGLAFWVYQSIAGQRLAIGPGGITYKSNSGNSIRATWDDITGYGTVNKGITEVEGFFVNEYAVDVNGGLKALVFLKPFILIGGILTGKAVGVGMPGNLDYTRQIPISLFSVYWLEDEIGTLIKQYAPRLFVPAGKFENGGDIIRGDIPVPTTRQSSELEPPAMRNLKTVKDTVIWPLTGGFTLACLLLFILGFVVHTNKETTVRAEVTQSAVTAAARNSQLTARAQGTATASAKVDADLKSFSQGLPEVQGLTEGDLPADNNLQTLSTIPNAKFKTLFATAYVYNPFGTSEGHWSYGFIVKSSADISYRLYINDLGVFSIYQIQSSGSTAKETRLDSGPNARIDTTTNGSNVVAVYETGDKLYFAINNHNITSVPLSAGSNSYEVKLVYQPSAFNQSSARPLHYKEFAVRGNQD